MGESRAFETGGERIAAMSGELSVLYDSEDHAHFMANLVEESPASFTLVQKRAILDELIESKTAMEDAMRESFAALGEQEQTALLDSLGASGYRDRAWWRRMLMDGRVHRELLTG